MNGRRRSLQRRMVVTAAAMLAAACAGNESSRAPAVAAYDTAAAIDPNNLAYVTGTLTYLQRIALPKDAVVAVDLFDLSNGVSRPAPVAERRFEAGGQVPIRFDLPYDRARITPQQSYGVRARILVDGALWFVNDPPAAVLTRGNADVVDLLLRPASPKD